MNQLMCADRSMEIFRTDRLVVRLMHPEDVNFLKELMSDPDVMRTTGFEVPQEPPKVQACLEKWMSDSDKVFGTWLVLKLENDDRLKIDDSDNSDVPVGWLMLRTIDSDVPEAGYMFIKEAWGLGYATELMFGLLKHATTNGVDRVCARVGDQNLPSIRVLEKVGFKRSLQEAETTPASLSFFWQRS